MEANTEIGAILKILHVVGDSKFGGGSVIISQIVCSQLDRGHEVKVLTTDADFIKHLSELNVETVKLNCIYRSYNLISDFFGIYKLSKFLRNNHFDVVHTHTTKAGFVGRISAFIANVSRIYHTVHGFPFSESSNKFKVFIFSLLERLLYLISSKVIFVSNYHLEWARSLKIANDDKALAIRNGGSIPTMTPDLSLPPFERCDGSKKIVYVGRLVKEKGLFDLLEAFKTLDAEIDDIHLIFVGDGPDASELKELSSGCKRIHFTGFVDNAVDYLSIADVFVLPSYREGLSVSAIEAQACGVASVLSDIGGNVEISENGKCALLFKVGSVQSLYEMLYKLLADDSLRKLYSSNARVNFVKNFSSDLMLTGYKNLYEEG